MKKNKKIIVAFTIILVIILALAVGWLIVPRCVHATRENGRYDVNNDGAINFQDSGLIHINSVEFMENYVYNMTCDMDCDNIVNVIDVDLCWENRD